VPQSALERGVEVARHVVGCRVAFKLRQKHLTQDFHVHAQVMILCLDGAEVDRSLKLIFKDAGFDALGEEEGLNYVLGHDVAGP
jgi:hypothetical protein